MRHRWRWPYFDPALRATAKKISDYYGGGPDPDDVRPRVRRIKQQTPCWVDRKHLRTMYQMAARVRRCTGLPYHLDHEIPLHGKRVSGLHVGANLRMLPASLNQKKHARFEP